MADIIITNANAGDIVVNDGDCFIIDPSLTDDVTFVNPSGDPVNFEIQINASNLNDLRIDFEDDPGMAATFTIANGVSLPAVQIDARGATSSTVNVGDNVELQEYRGSEDGDDTFTAGDNFDLDEDLDLGDGLNSFVAGDNFNPDGDNVNVVGGGDGNDFSIGENGQVRNIGFGGGEDSITLGDGSEFNDLRTRGGDDVVTLGDGVTGDDIQLSGGDDALNLGVLEEDALGDINGGSGTDTINTVTDPDDVDFANNITRIENINVICFTRGTLIETNVGQRPVETLAVGDRVRTLDAGLQPIRWIGGQTINGRNLVSRLRPVKIAAGCLGDQLPERDLLVSPQHRILAKSKIAMRMFDHSEILIAAKHLLDLDGVEVDETTSSVSYFHFLFDTHQIVFANGAPAESLHTGFQAMRTLAAHGREEVLEIFPELSRKTTRPTARYVAQNGRLARKLIARHKKHKRELIVQ